MSRAVGTYRVLLHLYPRGFRAEYGDDMALAFADLLHDEPIGRAWWRAGTDLARSVPRCHADRRRALRAQPAVGPFALWAVAVAGTILGVAAGTALGVGGFALTTAAGAAVGARLLQRRSSRPLATIPAARLLCTGGGLLGTAILIANVIEVESNHVWAPLMLMCIAGVLLLTLGAALGIADRLVAHRS